MLGARLINLEVDEVQLIHLYRSCNFYNLSNYYCSFREVILFIVKVTVIIIYVIMTHINHSVMYVPRLEISHEEFLILAMNHLLCICLF